MASFIYVRFTAAAFIHKHSLLYKRIKNGYIYLYIQNYLLFTFLFFYKKVGLSIAILKMQRAVT